MRNKIRNAIVAAVAITVAAACTTSSTATPAVAASLPPMDISQHMNIMPLGDSITSGFGDPSMDSYRWALANYLTETQQIRTAQYVGSQSSGSHGNTHHEGHNGYRLDQLNAGTPGWMAAYNPDLVYLHAGVNDAIQGATGQQMADRMRTLLTTILASSSTRRVIVSEALVPRAGSVTNDQPSIAVQQFNKALPGIVAAAGPRVSLARVTLAVPNSMMGDGVHPNGEAYVRMAWVFWRCTGPLLAPDGVVRSGRDPLPMPVPQDVLCPPVG